MATTWSQSEYFTRKRHIHPRLRLSLHPKFSQRRALQTTSPFLSWVSSPKTPFRPYKSAATPAMDVCPSVLPPTLTRPVSTHTCVLGRAAPLSWMALSRWRVKVTALPQPSNCSRAGAHFVVSERKENAMRAAMGLAAWCRLWWALITRDARTHDRPAIKLFEIWCVIFSWRRTHSLECEVRGFASGSPSCLTYSSPILISASGSLRLPGPPPSDSYPLFTHSTSPLMGECDKASCLAWTLPWWALSLPSHFYWQHAQQHCPHHLHCYGSHCPCQKTFGNRTTALEDYLVGMPDWLVVNVIVPFCEGWEDYFYCSQSLTQEGCWLCSTLMVYWNWQ